MKECEILNYIIDFLNERSIKYELQNNYNEIVQVTGIDKQVINSNLVGSGILINGFFVPCKNYGIKKDIEYIFLNELPIKEYNEILEFYKNLK